MILDLRPSISVLFVLFCPSSFIAALLVTRIQAGSSIKLQIPSDANVHAVFESYTLKNCTRV